MSPIYSAILVAAFLLCCQSSRNQPTLLQELGATDASDQAWFDQKGATFDAKSYLKRVYLVFFETKNGKLAYGTAVAVGPKGHLISNYHIFNDCIEGLGREETQELNNPEPCPGYFAIRASDMEKFSKDELHPLAENRDYAGLLDVLHREKAAVYALNIVSHWTREESLEREELSFDAVVASIDRKLSEGSFFKIDGDTLQPAREMPGPDPVFSLGFSAPKEFPSIGFEDLKARYSVGTIQEFNDEGILFSGSPYALSCSDTDTRSLIDINFGGSGSAVVDQHGRLVGLHVGTWQGDCAKATASVIIPIFNIYWRFLDEI